MQHLWEDTGKLKDDLEDMEKKLLEGKMEIERTMDDYVKLKVCVAVFLSCTQPIMFFVAVFLQTKNSFKMLTLLMYFGWFERFLFSAFDTVGSVTGSASDVKYPAAPVYTGSLEN